MPRTRTDRQLLEELELYLEAIAETYGKDPMVTHPLKLVREHLNVQDSQLEKDDAKS